MLYRRGTTWHYDFTVAGSRQRGTTHQTSESKARKVESTLASESAPSALLRKLTPLAKEEVESTRRILSCINAERQLDQFNEALGASW